jgi:hypothetical protein
MIPLARASEPAQQAMGIIALWETRVAKQALPIFRFDQRAAMDCEVDREIDHTGGYYERLMSSAFDFV